jgi:hypothetical protein
MREFGETANSETPNGLRYCFALLGATEPEGWHRLMNFVVRCRFWSVQMIDDNPMRTLILNHLRLSGKSRYWLANKAQQDPSCGVSRGAVYQYLRGKTDTTGLVIWACFKALNLRVVCSTSRRSKLVLD